jgi:cobalt/nickel transport system permease protein
MHAPDGFLNAGTAVATGAISAATIGTALRQSKHQIAEKSIPLAGITAAFIFAAQLFNFPVAAGTTGHLLGGALAAILLGPHLGALVTTVVVVVQALAFADGGLTALGYNVLNMAIIPAYGGFALYLLFRKVFPATKSGVVGSTALASGLSVVLGAAAFSIEWLFGATAPVPFDTVFSAMVGIHLLIGIGEGVISALTVGAVLATRPDLVYGARDLDKSALGSTEGRVPLRAFIIGGILAAVILATVISQFAVGDPDGLESVAQENGITGTENQPDTPFADYATTGIANEKLSLAIAGLAGVSITLLVGVGLAGAIRGPKQLEKQRN